MKIHVIGFLALTSILFSCGSNQPLETVEELELTEYMGTWYEIKRLPNRFEEDLICVTAEYSLNSDGSVKVVNSGFDTTKMEFTSSEGRAILKDTAKPGELEVTFFWPFSGDYCVIYLDEDYHHALVGDPSRKNLWLLSRTSAVQQETIQELMEKGKNMGFPVENWLDIPHSCIETPKKSRLKVGFPYLILRLDYS